MREVGQRHEQGRALPLDRIRLELEAADLLRPRLVGGKDRARILPLALGPRDIFGGRVLLPLQSLELGDQLAAPSLERGKLLQLGLGAHSPVLQRRTDVLSVFAQVRRIDHDRRSYTGCHVDRLRSKVRARRAPAGIARASEPFWRSTKRDADDPQGCLSRRWPGHQIPPRNQGAAEGNAAARRQAHHPVRRRGSGRLGCGQHHPRDRTRQERNRGSLRRRGRARDVPGGAREKRSGRRDPEDFQLPEFLLRPAGGAARARACGAGHTQSCRRRTLRGHPRRRCDRCGAAGGAADDRCLRGSERPRPGDRTGAAGDGQLLRHHRRRRDQAGRVPDPRPRRETAGLRGPLGPRHHRQVHPDP